MVTEGVKVRGRQSVRLDREVVGRAGGSQRMANYPRADHQVRYRTGIVARGAGGQRHAERDGLTRLHQPRGGGAFVIGDEVERPALVVLAPASPVADRFQQLRDLLGGVGRGHRTSSSNPCGRKKAAIRRSASSACTRAAPPRRCSPGAGSLGLLLLFQGLDFTPLTFDFALMLID